MKYIRTQTRIFENNGKIKKKDNYLQIWKTIDGQKKCDEYLIIKEANTIEELCDMFVVRKETCRDLLVAKSWAKSYNEILYGAIWTDKGLQYVAKLNQDGELELI